MEQHISGFDFGKNWGRYLHTINPEIIDKAQQSLIRMLRIKDLRDMEFFDAGCGSGLFSLAALKLGAKHVESIDINPECVECANILHEKYGPFPNWNIRTGSVLDRNLLTTLGTFDIVYSWGVLHHTGDMWRAFDNICELVKPGGYLYISIYNDQGLISKFWLWVKRFYNTQPGFIKNMIVMSYFLLVLINECSKVCLLKKPFSEWFKSSERGMSLWYDCVDWCGGYPYETAKAEQLFEYFYSRDFNLVNMKLKGGSGCNEMVFVRKKTETEPTSLSVSVPAGCFASQ